MPKPPKPKKVKRPTALDLRAQKPGIIKTGRRYRIEQEDTFDVHYRRPKKGKMKVE